MNPLEEITRLRVESQDALDKASAHLDEARGVLWAQIALLIVNVIAIATFVYIVGLPR